jgi:hypothetical protein
MSWTVACFCGNTYRTPPHRCQVCGRSVDELDATIAPAPTTAAAARPANIGSMPDTASSTARPCDTKPRASYPKR